MTSPPTGNSNPPIPPLRPAAADRWARIESVFNLVADLDGPTRRAVLDRECGDDAELRSEVEHLLRADGTGSGFIGDVIAGAAATLAADRSRIGESLGAYRITAEIGHGGMGTVYLAERADEQYRARVAIKVLRGALATPELERRFRAERQILADLVHPNIARLLDGGTAADGTPYLVMEYIEGEPLDAWCVRLGLRDRVALVIAICAAVQHAHQALVIHRDIKPSNILVTAAGEPKLVDFGIAKPFAPRAGDAGGTTTALNILTPTHASPEQLRGQRITTASDVYSLGVVLYQLAAGDLPFDVAGRSIGEIERLVCETEPARPSSRAPARWARAVRGDLDNIILKALRKEPARRYGSAAELAEDLRRHLHGLPVTARADTLSYRAGKFARRHVVGVAASAAIVVLLLSLAMTSTVQARRLARERDLAEERRLTAERVTAFLVDLFGVADPNESGGRAVTAREMLDQGARRVLTELPEEPAVRATLAGTMGEVYRNLGLYAESRGLIDSALSIRRAIHAPDDPAVATALHEKAELLYAEGAYDSAAAIHRGALEIRRQRLGPQHADIASSLVGLAATLDELGDFVESERLYREALAMDRSVHGPEHEMVAVDMTNLAGVLRSQAKYDEAVTLLESALVLNRRARGNEHLDVAATLNQLSRTLALARRSEEALPPVREALAIQRRVHGAPHPETAASLGNLAGILGDLGRLEESEATRRESLAMLRQVFGDAHPYIAATMNSLGDVLLKRRDLPAAEDAYREALRLHRRVLGAGNPNIGYPLTGLGLVLVERGRAGEAEPLLREAHELRRRGLPPNHWHTAASASALGLSLTGLGRFGEAEPLLASSLATLDSTFGAADARTRLARDRLAAMYDASGRPADAARVRGTGGGG